MQRVIGLIDCDSFFVSCEVADNPSLRGKPVVVAGGDRGCVVSRSKEAKAIGVKMGAPVFMEKRDHPQTVFVYGNMDKYVAYSKRVMNVIRNYSPDVETASVDEAYIDLTGMDKVYKCDYTALAHKIRDDVYAQTQIPVSIGLAPSKTLAKLAADLAKKDGAGVLLIKREDIQSVLRRTPIGQICGIGRMSGEKMRRAAVYSGEDFVTTQDARLQKLLGKNGLDLKYELLGYALSKVHSVPEKPKSVQDTRALADFTRNRDIVRAGLLYHVHRVCARLRALNGYCSSVGILLRTKDFAVFTDKTSLPRPTNDEKDLVKAADALLNGLYSPCLLYRSTGITAENLSFDDDAQGDLFASEIKRTSPLNKALDSLEAKFGKNIVRRAGG